MGGKREEIKRVLFEGLAGGGDPRDGRIRAGSSGGGLLHGRGAPTANRRRGEERRGRCVSTRRTSWR